MSVLPDSGLMVMLIAVPSLPMCSSELSTFKSVEALSGEGDLKAKLCDGDCCIDCADDVCGIIEDAAEETGGCKCEGCGIL